MGFYSNAGMAILHAIDFHVTLSQIQLRDFMNECEWTVQFPTSSSVGMIMIQSQQSPNLKSLNNREIVAICTMRSCYAGDKTQ